MRWLEHTRYRSFRTAVGAADRLISSSLMKTLPGAKCSSQHPAAPRKSMTSLSQNTKSLADPKAFTLARPIDRVLVMNSSPLRCPFNGFSNERHIMEQHSSYRETLRL